MIELNNPLRLGLSLFYYFRQRKRASALPNGYFSHLLQIDRRNAKAPTKTTISEDCLVKVTEERYSSPIRFFPNKI